MDDSTRNEQSYPGVGERLPSDDIGAESVDSSRAATGCCRGREREDLSDLFASLYRLFERETYDWEKRARRTGVDWWNR